MHDGGLCTTIELESLTICTLEPARWIIVTPKAVSSDSISAHLMSAGVGAARIRSSVRRCRLGISSVHHPPLSPGAPQGTAAELVYPPVSNPQ